MEEHSLIASNTDLGVICSSRIPKDRANNISFVDEILPANKNLNSGMKYLENLHIFMWFPDINGAKIFLLHAVKSVKLIGKENLEEFLSL